MTMQFVLLVPKNPGVAMNESSAVGMIRTMT